MHNIGTKQELNFCANSPHSLSSLDIGNSVIFLIWQTFCLYLKYFWHIVWSIWQIRVPWSRPAGRAHGLYNDAVNIVYPNRQCIEWSAYCVWECGNAVGVLARIIPVSRRSLPWNGHHILLEKMVNLGSIYRTFRASVWSKRNNTFWWYRTFKTLKRVAKNILFRPKLAFWTDQQHVHQGMYVVYREILGRYRKIALSFCWDKCLKYIMKHPDLKVRFSLSKKIFGHGQLWNAFIHNYKLLFTY